MQAWVWVTQAGDFFGLDREDFREAGINPERRTPRLNYAILGDFLERFMADERRNA